MLRNIQVCLFVVMSLILSLLLGGCGSSNKEGDTASSVPKVDEATCRVCHASTLDPKSGTPLLPEYLASVHNTADRGCQGCHGGGAQHNGVGPIPFPNPLDSNRCNNSACHNNRAPSAAVTADFISKCAPCHTASGNSDVHAARAIQSLPNPDSCVDCHDVPAPQHGALVGDNDGVRAIVPEFAKWSHHVTGVTVNNAHCAACHLEGTVSADGQVVVDTTKHMVDAKIHLRNADSDAEFTWDPATPNHANMDNFCMSCHDANGATSPMSVKIQGFINSNGKNAPGKTASATNPFGDTISNRYDKMQRPGVVDVSSQFNTTNNSHHAVKGKRYTGRTRAAGPRQIASPATFANNSSAVLDGVRKTIYDAGNFNSLYVPLGTDPATVATTGLGDDSTLHCGDCHTVGQWKPGSSVDSAGRPTTAAIGAHGSNNEYLLRNSIGTDERHTQNAFVTVAGIVQYTNPDGPFLVCYNCHSYSKYGSIYGATGAQGGHAGEYDQAGRCNGIGNTLPFGGYTTGKATDGTQFEPRLFGVPGVNSPGAPYAGEQATDFGNIFGIQCNNCHNSGPANGYGGIHGSKINTYIDGMGNQNKVERFLPGLGNTKYVPGTLGGITGGATVGPVTNSRNDVGHASYSYTTGGVSNDANWEQRVSAKSADGTANFAGAGCYTLSESATAATFGQKGLSVDGGATTPDLFGTWGGCDDHGAAQGAGDHGIVKKIVRPITY